MSNLISSIRFTKTYSKIVLPIYNKRIIEYQAYTNRIKNPLIKASALASLEKLRFETQVSSTLTLYPNVNVETATDLLFSFQAIIQYINSICMRYSNNSDTFFKVIYSSLKDAVNLRTDSYENYFKFFPSKDDSGFLTLLVEKCRQKVRLLPSFEIIRDYINAYLTLFIDLQTIKFSSSEENIQINLLNFAINHGNKNTDLTDLEFCMAIDSTLFIQELLVLATIPDLTEAILEDVSRIFSPWLCGIHKILEGYLYHNEAPSFDNMNSIFNYNNLKEYETRMIHFINKLLETPSPFSKMTYKLLLSLYTTVPIADKGMNRFTTKAFIRIGGSGMLSFITASKIIKSLKDINQK